MKRVPFSHEGVFRDEAFAQRYARKHWKMAEGFGREYEKKLRRYGFHKGRILDAGCGFGATDLYLAEQFDQCELVGIDLSQPLLKMAEDATQSTGLGSRVTFKKADVHEIPFEDDSFDVVLNLNMAHLVSDSARMLGEIERVLAPEGFLFIADLRRSWLGLIEREIRSSFSSVEAKALIDRSGVRQGVFSPGLLWWRFESYPTRLD